MAEHDHDRPLISFCLFAYNQEPFIREAVEGALAQTYSPLQIVISDDGSTDRTFEIIQDAVSRYTGPHRVLLNRNAANLGLISHVNKVCLELAQADLLVVAAGDDVSLPERTERLWAAWRDASAPAFCVTSGLERIDPAGRVLDRVSPSREGECTAPVAAFITGPAYDPDCRGATAMYHREVFSAFGPLAQAKVEDAPLLIRARLCGSVLQVQSPLVKYRVSAESLSAKIHDYKGRCRRICVWNLATYEQLQSDLKRPFLREKYGDALVEEWVQAGLAAAGKRTLMLKLIDGSLGERIRAYRDLLPLSHLVEKVNNLFLIFPTPLYNWLIRTVGLPTDSWLWRALLGIKRKVRRRGGAVSAAA